MSRYEELRDAAFEVQHHPDLDVSGEALENLHVELENVADDIQRLWRATEPKVNLVEGVNGWYGIVLCAGCLAMSKPVVLGSLFDPADDGMWQTIYATMLSDGIDHTPGCPHEALRPLFGEVAE